LPPFLGQLLRNQARNKIGGSTGHAGTKHAYGFRGVDLRDGWLEGQARHTGYGEA